MTTWDLMPYLSIPIALLALLFVLRRARGDQLRLLECKSRELEHTIQSLLRENARKDAEIQSLSQQLLENRQRIWQLEQEISSEEADQDAVARVEEAFRIVRLRREKSNELAELIRLQTESGQYGLEVPDELAKRIKAAKTAISRLDRRLRDIQGSGDYRRQ